MCLNCNSSTTIHFRGYAKERLQDPTRTLMIRDRFVKEVNKRFASFLRAITEALVDKDVLGLASPKAYVNPKQFNFPTNPEKVQAFMQWLNELIEKELLTLGNMPQLGQARQQAWTDLYVADSYKRGVQRARYEMGKAGMPVPSLDKTGGISASMSTPFHLDRVGMIYIRTYEDLKDITTTMSNQISKVLSQGIIDGDGPALLARKIRSTVSGGDAALGITDSLGRFIPAKRRAQTLARTEVIRAHHLGMVQEYKNWALEGVIVQAEWTTAGDDRVCDVCKELEGKVYTLEEVKGLIPRHPNCRCIALPKVVDKTPKQKAIAQKGKPSQLWNDLTELPIGAITATENKQLKNLGINMIGYGQLEDADALLKVNTIGDVIGNTILKKLPKVKNMISETPVTIYLSTTQYAAKIHGALMTYQPYLKIIDAGTKGTFIRNYLPLKKGQFSIGGGVMQSNLTHEFGHHIHLSCLSLNDRIRWNVVVNEIGLDEIKRSVSVYAGTNTDEAFAECFAAYCHPEYKPGFLPRMIEKTLEKLIGKRTDL